MPKLLKNPLLLTCSLAGILGLAYGAYIIARQEILGFTTVGILQSPTTTFSLTVPQGEYHELVIQLDELASYVSGTSIEGSLSIGSTNMLFDLSKVTQRNTRMNGKQTNWGFIVLESRRGIPLLPGRTYVLKFTLPDTFPKNASLRLNYVYRYGGKWFTEQDEGAVN